MRIQMMNGAGPRRLLGVLAAAGAAALVACGASTSSEKPLIPPGAWLSTWHDNGAGGRYLLHIERGQALADGETLAGVVKTDTDCEPDRYNLNHCRNTIELSDGRWIDVIDNHEMTRYRCLQPGESIIVTRFNSDWVVGRVSGT